LADNDILVERRAYPRWTIDLELTFKQVKSDNSRALSQILAKSFKAVTVNISGGGTLLLTDHTLVPGERLDINLRLQSSENAVKILAEVARVEAGKAALKFLKISTESDELLQGMIRQKMRFSARTKMTQQEALALAQKEFFLRMLDEELTSRNM